jgi:hypothetical protein
VQPSSKIERWQFRRVFDACGLCGIETRSSGSRAFDSRRDLFNAAGNVESVPDLRFPNGKLASPRVPMFRASLCEPCDRVTLYLNCTTAAPHLVGEKPNGMLIELRTGLDCLEEVQLVQPCYPKAYDDGGMVFTWATPVLFSSIVLTGTTLAVDPTDPPQAVSLRLQIDRCGLYLAPGVNPIVGALAVP